MLTSALDLAAALVALAVLSAVLLAWRRRGGGAGNLIAGVIAVASLWLLYVRPVVERTLAPRSAWLITPGGVADVGVAPAAEAAVDASDATNVGSTRVAADDAGVAGAHGGSRAERLESFALPGAFSTPPTTMIPDLRWLARHRPEVDLLRVSGHGLAAPEWGAVDGGVERWSLRWRIAAELPPLLARGFAAVNWTRELALGSDLIVRGLIAACPECREVRLEGAGAGGDAGSSTAPGEDGSFELRVRPRAAGRFLPELVAVNETGSPVLRQAIDVVVAPPAPLALLWLERAPSFESRAVRRWRQSLEGGDRPQGEETGSGRFVLRSTWSRGRVRTAVVGGPAAAALPTVLDQRSLSEFDVVVADVESLRALRGPESAALAQAVRAGGLGLLLRLHGEERLPAADPLLAGWRVRPLSGLDELLARVVWPGFEAAEPLAIAARELQPEWGARPLVADRAGRVLAAARVQGSGAVAVSLLEGTYRWTLAGDRDAHARLWSRLLHAVARPRAAGWNVPSGPALVDWPFELVFSAARAPAEVSCREPDGATVALPFATRAHEPGRTLARFWPRVAGWHACAGTVDGARVETEFFAHPAEPWQVWLDSRRHDSTAQAAAFTAARPLVTGAAVPVRRPVELPRWPFYASFLLAVGYLWAAERWRGASTETVAEEKEIAA